MSDYSATFPSQRPVFSQDFAQSGKIDPRATFSRSDSPIDVGKAAAAAVHYWSNEKHLSSDNLLLQSSDFDTGWASQGLVSKTGGQTDPSGGTDGWTLRENSSTGFHRITQTVSASGEVAYTVYAKRNAGTRYLLLSFSSSAGGVNGAGLAAFDLAGGATHTANGSTSTLTNLSATQTASGNGYYKCVFKVTGTITVAYLSLSNTGTPAANNYGLINYAGDGTSSIDVAFASLSTTGATDYQSTTTQIHREYAPTLQTAASGAARFEHLATDGQSAGTSLGILLESSRTNLLTYSNDFSQWGATNVVAEAGAAVGPDGQLCYVMREDSTAGVQHRLALSANNQSYSAAHTMSVYAKKVAASNQTRYLRLRVNGLSGEASVQFDLSNGTVVRTSGSQLDGQSISSVGNGWYRITMTYSNTASERAVGMIITGSPDTTDTLPSYDGDGFSAFALFGAMVEEGSHASSLVTSNSGSQTTRAADSLSITDSSLFSGNEGTIAFEGQTLGGSTGFGRFWTISDGTNDNRIHAYPTSSTAVRFRVYRNGIEQRNVASGVTDVTQSNRYAFAYEDNKLRLAQNGTLITDDSNNAVMPVVDKLSIGINAAANSNSMNGHVKRIAFYNQSLSDTEMASLSS